MLHLWMLLHLWRGLPNELFVAKAVTTKSGRLADAVVRGNATATLGPRTAHRTIQVLVDERFNMVLSTIENTRALSSSNSSHLG